MNDQAALEDAQKKLETYGIGSIIHCNECGKPFWYHKDLPDDTPSYCIDCFFKMHRPKDEA